MAYILDTPLPAQNVPECVATHLDDVGRVQRAKDKAGPYAGRMAAVDKTLGQSGVTTLDPTRLFCTTQACPAVVGNILVYRDGSHIARPTAAGWRR